MATTTPLWLRPRPRGQSWSAGSGGSLRKGAGLHRQLPQAPGRVLWLLPREDGDLSSLGQLLDHLGLVVRVVDAGLPELSGVAVLLPVVVPVPTAVGPEAKDVDLEDSRANQKAAGGGGGGRGRGGD